VTINDSLGALAPRLEAADLASLELAVKSGGLELQFAEREQQRLEGLRGQGAVPERRVQDATHAAEEAQANLVAAQRRLDQFRRAEHNVGRAESTIPLLAPLFGTITAVHVAPGSFVEAGAALFRVTDLTQLWLEAHVPAADLARLDSPRGASFVVEGSERAIELPPGALVTRARVIDPASQTLALLFAVDNAGGGLPVGAFCRVLLITGDERRVLALPESAVVDDSGTFVVFVQSEGEAFERRIVRLGVRDRGLVEIVSGVQRGEHVVTRGAWSVKLAASSGAIPAHGHSH
jgi:RND family efflux transporter MFP subunit